MDISININVSDNLSDGRSTPEEFRDAAEALGMLRKILDRRAPPPTPPPFLPLQLNEAQKQPGGVTNTLSASSASVLPAPTLQPQPASAEQGAASSHSLSTAGSNETDRLAGRAHPFRLGK